MIKHSGQQFASAALYDKLRYVEWCLIAATLAMQLSWSPIVNPVSFFLPHSVWSALLLCALAGINAFRPGPSILGRTGVIFLLELLLVSSSSYLGSFKFFFLIYIVIIAKAGLLLNRTRLLLALALTILTHFGVHELKWHEFDMHRARVTAAALERYNGSLRSESQVYFIIAALFVAAMSRALVGEQQNRLEAQRLAQEVEKLVRSSERTRISREIHDGVGHHLTSLSVQLDVAKKLYELDPNKSKQALVAARELASRSLSEIRHAVEVLRDDDEHQTFNLNEALLSLAQQMRHNSQIELELSLNSPDLPLAKAHNLYCIVQECLTNAQKHAGSSAVSIAIATEQDRVIVKVKDNGVGFEPESKATGYGIKGMKERTELMGGTFSIASSPSSGTEVRVAIPA